MNSSMEDRLARARLSLNGLSLGDAFGQQFFGKPEEVEALIAQRAIPKAPWHYTDDTEMALAVMEVLREYKIIDADALARSFARRYSKDPRRGYGGTAHEILRSIGEGMPWQKASSSAFSGMGSMGNGGAMRVAPIGA